MSSSSSIVEFSSDNESSFCLEENEKPNFETAQSTNLKQRINSLNKPSIEAPKPRNFSFKVKENLASCQEKPSPKESFHLKTNQSHETENDCKYCTAHLKKKNFITCAISTESFIKFFFFV